MFSLEMDEMFLRELFLIELRKEEENASKVRHFKEEGYFSKRSMEV